MKFISLQENLKTALSVVGHVVSKNINLPILNNILFRVAKSEVELLATNLEIGIIHKMRAKIEEEGEFTVDSKVVSDYINLLPSDKVELESQNEAEMKVSCNNYKTKIKIQSAQDFPLIPVVDKNNFYSVNIEDLKKSLSEVIFATANNETRLELSGVLFVVEKDELILVATDSYRLAEKRIKIKNHGLESAKTIVPGRTLQELLRILSNFKAEEQIEDGGDLKICLSENQILFLFGSTEMVSRVITGSYPDYKQIIPQTYNTQLLINKNDLIRAIKASAIFSKSGINDVNFEFKKGGKISISSASSQVGESLIELEGEMKGEDNDVVINYRYILDGLNNLESDRIIMELTNNNTPCTLRAENENNYLYIVMPIRQ